MDVGLSVSQSLVDTCKTHFILKVVSFPIDYDVWVQSGIESSQRLYFPRNLCFVFGLFSCPFAHHSSKVLIFFLNDLFIVVLKPNTIVYGGIERF